MGSSSVVEVFGINKVEQGIAMLFSSYGVANTVAPIIAGNLNLIENTQICSNVSYLCQFKLLRVISNSRN